jgi:hypothetical protein
MRHLSLYGKIHPTLAIMAACLALVSCDSGRPVAPEQQSEAQEPRSEDGDSLLWDWGSIILGTNCQRRVKMSHSWRLKMSHPPGSEELASGHGTLLGFATLLRGLVGRGGG